MPTRTKSEALPILKGRKVYLGFSGGPDATALAAKLQNQGATVVPVYVDYRASAGGKTSKDLRFARQSAQILGLSEPAVVRAPLGERPKSERNRFFIEVLTGAAQEGGGKLVALGTMLATYEAGGDWDEESNRDLDPKILGAHAAKVGVKVITWDSFGVTTKAGEFAGLKPKQRKAVAATTSCQMWWHVECGNCGSCKERRAAFLAAFGKDETNYRPNSKAAKMQ